MDNQTILRLAGLGNSIEEVDELWEILGKDLSMAFEKVPPPQWMSNMTATDALQHSTAFDVTWDPFVMMPKRMHMFNFSKIVGFSHFYLEVSNTELFGESWFSFDTLTSLFSPKLWYSIAVTGLVLLSTSLLASREERNGIWPWLAYFAGQDSSFGTASGACMKLVMVATALLTIHSIHLYQGTLLAQLVRPVQYTPPFKNGEDVTRLILNEKAVLNLLFKDYAAASVFESVMQDANQRYDLFRSAIKKTPPVYLIRTNPEHRRRIAEIESTGKLLVSIVQEDVLFKSVGPNGDKCDFVFLPLDFDSTPNAFVYSSALNQTYREKIDAAITRHEQLISSIQIRFRAQTMRQYAMCRQRLYERQAPLVGDSLKLFKLSPVMIIWLSGAAIAALCFIIERMFYSERVRNRGIRHLPVPPYTLGHTSRFRRPIRRPAIRHRSLPSY